MLARFAYLYRDEIKLSELPSHTLLKIQHLLAYRQRLVKSKAALQVAAQESASFNDKQFNSTILRDSQKHITQLSASIVLVISNRATVASNDHCRRLAGTSGLSASYLCDGHWSANSSLSNSAYEMF